MTATHRDCVVCGARFKRSRADTTRRCPDCRSGRKRAQTTATKSVICSCGKTVIVDGFGTRTGFTCPQCGDA